MKSERLILLILILFSVLFLASRDVEAKDITYNRDTAREYASRHCGTSENTNYNFSQYKCWNAKYDKCENYGQKNKKGQYVGVDCANYASQALIAGGLDFAGSNGAITIGKGENAGTKGHPSVKNLLSALLAKNCFEITTDPSKAQPGDILSSTKDSHVVI